MVITLTIISFFSWIYAQYLFEKKNYFINFLKVFYVKEINVCFDNLINLDTGIYLIDYQNIKFLVKNKKLKNKLEKFFYNSNINLLINDDYVFINLGNVYTFGFFERLNLINDKYFLNLIYFKNKKKIYRIYLSNFCEMIWVISILLFIFLAIILNSSFVLIYLIVLLMIFLPHFIFFIIKKVYYNNYNYDEIIELKNIIKYSIDNNLIKKSNNKKLPGRLFL
ncbi:MAG: hypothetical protein WC337_11475 [Candidatus Muiribacteriota bacterium]